MVGSAGFAPRQPQAPTFNRDIAPIVFSHCAACHHPGGAGPFSLLTYQDVSKRAEQIAAVTATRYMPPWLPEPNETPFVDEQRLSDAQVRLFRQWIDAGMPEGDRKDLPAPPSFNAGWQLGKPDLILRMKESFTVPAEGTDVFRNFVLPIPVETVRYVKAVEILPGNKQVVHHANLLIDRGRAGRAMDARDPEPGFAGMEVSVEAESFDPDSHFLFWKPGSPPAVEPEGMAWRCDPGTDLILNMHLQPTGKPERIEAEIGLYFTDKPQTIFPMLLQLEHDGAIDIPPGKKDFTITDSLRLPIDVDVLGVYPHAHYLGRDLEGVATLPDGTRRSLVHITRWDLNWQGIYKYRQPIFLPKGSVLSMRYRYDNSAENLRNPHRPPRRVRAGNRSSEEMSHLWVQVLPRQARIDGQDARVLLQEALMRRRLEKYPADFTAHFNLGAALQTAGRDRDALPHFQRALQARPESAAAHTSLAVSLQALGNTAQAMTEYKRALQLNPAYSSARYNLANLLLAQGAIEEAIGHLNEILRLSPNDAGAHNSLGSALGMQGKPAEAAVHFSESLRIDPNNADALGNLAAIMVQLKRYDEAVRHFEAALQIHESADLHNELGVVLGMQRKIDAAISHFERAIAIDGNHAVAKENLRKAKAIKR